MRIHLAFAFLAVALGFLFRIDPVQWLIILLFVALVLSLEMLNTALELIVDRVSPEYSDMAKHAKDCAAGAVLVCAVAAFVAGVVLFAPPILLVLFG